MSKETGQKWANPNRPMNRGERIRTWVLAFLFLALSVVAGAQEEGDLRQLYTQAEEEYNIGHIDASIQLLNKGMASFQGALKVSAYRLMSLCHLGKDEPQEAERYVSLLLKEDPYYSTTISDPLRFAEIVERFKQGEATITTASQQAEALSEAPVPVTLITEEMIKASGARTLADLLLLYVPGMSPIEGSEMNVAMHGVYSSSQEKILILLDGHRLNSRATNSEAPDYRNSLDKIKQIEVLRGPASSLYGNVALTAVVNIITKRGREVNGVEVSAKAGNNRSYQADFLMGKSGLGIDFLAWASVYTSRGEKREVDVDDPDFYGKIPRAGTMYIGGYNHKPAYDLGFTAQWNDLRLLFSMQEAKRVDTYNTVLYPGLYDYDRYRKVNGSKPGRRRQATHADLSYEKAWGENWSGKISAFLDMENGSYYDVGGDSILEADRYIPAGPGEVIPGGPATDMCDYGIYQVQSWNDYTYGASAQANYLFQQGQWNGSLLFGLQVENYTMQDNSMLIGDHFDRIIVTYSGANRALELGSELNVSPFAQLKLRWGERLIFNGGLRYDYKHRYNGRKLNVVSPRLSFIYKLAKNANLKLGYSHSFVDAPFFYRASKIDTYSGGSTLEPEQMDAVQLTFDGSSRGGDLKYETNLYYNRLIDLIYYDAQKLEDMYSNAGSLNLLGIEGTLSYTNPRALASLNLSYQRVLSNTNYTAEGAYIYNVPNFMMNAMYRHLVFKDKRHSNYTHG